jgi:uncharacterized protein YbjQ (UPF0145 family)
MDFWRHKTPAEEAAAAEQKRQRDALQVLTAERAASARYRQEQDAVRLQQGGIPIGAEERLRELANARPGSLAFTSDLSPDESGLLRRRGYQPLGLVTGSCVYHVGTAYASAYSDCEVAELSGAYNEATRLAVTRMAQEARMVKAHGVVGVRFDMVRHEWGQKQIEVQLVGTAVRGPGAAPKVPWLSDLSGQEWWSLTRAGYEPVALVWGHCTWFILTRMQDEWTAQSWSNQELGHFSQALTQCRNRAERTMHGLAQQAEATGVVGVRFARKLEEIRLTGAGVNPAYEREHHNLTLSMVGTAIRESDDTAHSVRATVPVLSLRDGRLLAIDHRPGDATFE